MLFRSFLSPNAEVKIGNNITRFINKDVAVTVSALNDLVLAMARQLPSDITKREVRQMERRFPSDFHVDDWSVQDLPLQYSNSGQPTPIDDPYQPLNGVKIRTTNPDDSFVTPMYDPNNRIKLGSGDKDPGNLSVDNWVPYVPAPHYYADGAGYIGDKPNSSDYRVGNSNTTIDSCAHTVSIGPLFMEHHQLLAFPPVAGDKYEWVAVPAVFLVYWGDPASPGPAIIPFLGSGGGVFSSHHYVNPGTYDILVSGYPTSVLSISLTGAGWGTPLASASGRITIGCGVRESRDGEAWNEADTSEGRRKIKGVHWIHQWKSFGVERARAFARTEAYHWASDGHGHWAFRKFHRNGLHVHMFFDMYDGHDCHSLGEQEYSADTTDWEVETQVTYSSFFGWSYIRSRHVLDSSPRLEIGESFITRVC